jgi:hypothetical protein
VPEIPPTLPPDAETRSARRKALTKTFIERASENLWLKAVSIGLAVLLWYVITQKEPTATSIPVKLVLRLDSAIALRLPAPDIIAVIQGTPGDLARLEGRAATITRSIPADTPDTIIMALSRNDVMLPDNVGNVRITDISPKAVRLEFVQTMTRRIPVRSAIRIVGPDSILQPGVDIEPARVEISGPRTTVSRIDFIRTDTAFVLATDSLPHQVTLDTTGLGVNVNPSQVRVRLRHRRPAAPPVPR